MTAGDDDDSWGPLPNHHEIEGSSPSTEADKQADAQGDPKNKVKQNLKKKSGKRMMGSPLRKIGTKKLKPLGLHRNSQTPPSGERGNKVPTQSLSKKVSPSIQRRMISSMELVRHEADSLLKLVQNLAGIKSTPTNKLSALAARIEAKLTKEEASLRCHNVVPKTEGEGDEDLFDHGDAICSTMHKLQAELTVCSELVSAFQSSSEYTLEGAAQFLQHAHADYVAAGFSPHPTVVEEIVIRRGKSMQSEGQTRGACCLIDPDCEMVCGLSTFENVISESQLQNIQLAISTILLQAAVESGEHDKNSEMATNSASFKVVLLAWHGPSIPSLTHNIGDPRSYCSVSDLRFHVAFI